MNGKDNAPAHPKSDSKLSSVPGEPVETEEPDEHERARLEKYVVSRSVMARYTDESKRLCCRTMALRMQYELYTLDHFDSFAQEYLDDKGIDEATFSQMLREEDNEVGETAWDDTTSMSSGMDWFLPSPSESEFGDDDAISLHVWCESQKKDDEAYVAKEKKNAEDALHAAELVDQGKPTPDQVKIILREYSKNSR